MADYLLVEEYDNEMPKTSVGGVLPIPPIPLAFQRVAITAASTLSNPLNAKTKFVMLTAEVACHVEEGPAATVTATAASRQLVAGVPREMRVANIAGNKIATITRQA